MSKIYEDKKQVEYACQSAVITCFEKQIFEDFEKSNKYKVKGKAASSPW